MSRQHHHMESFDDLDLDQASQEWQISPAPSLHPYGAISSVKLAWIPTGQWTPLSIEEHIAATSKICGK